MVDEWVIQQKPRGKTTSKILFLEVEFAMPKVGDFLFFKK